MPKVKPTRRKAPITGRANASAGVGAEASAIAGTVSLKSKSQSSSAAKYLGHSHKATQDVISSFHTLLKRQSQLKERMKQPATAEQARKLKLELQDVQAHIEDQGGLEAYQVASTLGQAKERGGDSSKVLVEWLLELGIGPVKDGAPKLRMLELGCLSPDNYAASQSWIENTPIDLNSRHPDIKSQDFLLRPLPKSDDNRFNIISCSLVLNFVSTPKDRGKMLLLAHEFLLPSDSSYFFFVLPLPCLLNSRYLTRAHFGEIMRVVGFSLVKERYKEGGKVIYSLWKRGLASKPKSPLDLSKKTIINEGKKRNNFCILL